jgi:hypothetical protein
MVPQQREWKRLPQVQVTHVGFSCTQTLTMPKMYFRAKVSAVDGQSGFLHKNVIVGIAWDGTAGKLLFSLDGADFTQIPFPEPVTPNVVAGAALYPVFSGRGGCTVRYNMGGTKQGKFQHNPPSTDYISCAEMHLQQVKNS